MMNGMSGLGFGFSGGIFMILWWVAIIAGVVLLVRWLAQLPSRGGQRTDALAILEERYARGELTSEEFNRMRRELGR